MARPTKYSPDELVRLSSLISRMSTADAAREMGWTRRAVEGLKERHGLRGRTMGARLEPKNPSLSPTQLAYLAGLIDGEGTVTVKRVAYKWTGVVSIANTSKPLMDWLRAAIPNRGAHIRTQTMNGMWRPLYQFVIIGLAWGPLHEALLPYLVVKRPQMELVLEFCRLRLAQHNHDPLTDRHLQIVAAIRALNTRGFSPSPDEASSAFLSSTSKPRPTRTVRSAT